MKIILFYGTFVILHGVSNGAVPQNDTDSDRGLARDLRSSTYSYRLPYGTSGFSYGPSSSAGFTINSLPFMTNFDTPVEALCSYRITNEVLLNFRVSIYTFITRSFRKAAGLSQGHFVFSPYTIWLSLAALAEGAEGPVRNELFSLLSLPKDRCLRQVFQQLATTIDNPSNDVVLARNRLFVVDSSLNVNENWKNFAQSQTKLNTVSIPFKNNPYGEIEGLKRVFKAQLPNINLSGNSFLLESLDYHGIWMSAFSDAVIESGPFYNVYGEQIGTVEYMKTLKRVNIAYAPTANMKVIELPVGRDGRYKMYFGIILGKQDHGRSINGFKNSLIFETLANLRPTALPIEIVIPRLSMTSETDARKVSEDLGINNLWTDPSATRNISVPAALPSSFIQRVTVTLDNNGFRPSIQEYSNFVPPVYSDPGSSPNLPGSEDLNDFVANRPFLFAFFDSDTYTVPFGGAFANPNNY